MSEDQLMIKQLYPTDNMYFEKKKAQVQNPEEHPVCSLYIRNNDYVLTTW